ncbi:MAG: hypothetical protein ACK57B_15075 [Betaproteobacteria bacterium]
MSGRAERQPVNRLFFVGRTDHAHAVETGRSVDKSIEAVGLVGLRIGPAD